MGRRMNEIDKRRVRLSCLRSGIHDHNAYIKELSYLVEHFLKEEYQSIIKRANSEIAKDLPEFEKSFIAGCYGEDVDKVKEVFPRMLRYSLFVASMSKLESDIISLCKRSQKIFGFLSTFKTKPPNVINRGIDYLIEQLGISTRKFRHYIKLVDNYRLIRNCIVHSEGDITERGDEEPLLRRFIARSSTLTIDRHNRIILLEGFVAGVSHSTELFWDRLLDAIKEKLDIHQPHRAGRE
jgi:hypothetical protein